MGNGVTTSQAQAFGLVMSIKEDAAAARTGENSNLSNQTVFSCHQRIDTRRREYLVCFRSDLLATCSLKTMFGYFHVCVCALFVILCSFLSW